MTFLILFGILLDLHTICLGCLHGSHNVYTVASRKSLFTLININIWCWGVIFSVELPFLISDSVSYLVLSVLPFHFKIKRISKILVFFFFQNLLNKSFFFCMNNWNVVSQCTWTFTAFISAIDSSLSLPNLNRNHHWLLRAEWSTFFKFL